MKKLILTALLCCFCFAIPFSAFAATLVDDGSTLDFLVDPVNLFTDTTNGDWVGDDARIRKNSEDYAEMVYAVNGHTHARVVVYEADAMPTHDMQFQISSDNVNFADIMYASKEVTEPEQGWYRTVYDVYFDASTTRLKIVFTVPGADFWAQQVGEVTLDYEVDPAAAPASGGSNAADDAAGGNVSDVPIQNPQTSDNSSMLYPLMAVASFGLIVALVFRQNMRGSHR